MSKEKTFDERFDEFFEDWKLNRIDKYCIGKCPPDVFCDGCRNAVKNYFRKEILSVIDEFEMEEKAGCTCGQQTNNKVAEIRKEYE